MKFNIYIYRLNTRQTTWISPNNSSLLNKLLKPSWQALSTPSPPPPHIPDDEFPEMADLSWLECKGVPFAGQWPGN